MASRLATLACCIHAAGAMIWPAGPRAPRSLTQAPLAAGSSSRPARQQPQHLSSGSPCGPTAAEEQEQGVEMSEDWQAAERLEDGNKLNLKFYLHMDGVFDFSDMVNCYFEAIGEKYKVDLVVYPVDAEHSTDVRLIRRMSLHESRTFDASEAAIHVIGSPLNTAWLAAQLEGSPCGTTSEFEQRKHSLSSAIRDLDAFQKTPGKFVFIDSDWRVGRAFGNELIDLMRGNATLASADHQINHMFGHAAKSVAIPYRANFMLDRAARSFAKDEALSVPSFEMNEDVEALARRRRMERPVTFHADPELSRDTSILFHGNMHGAMNDATRRDILRNITDGIANTSLQDVNFRHVSIDEMANVSMATAGRMLQSVFCLVPGGDTPSSRRLFDALAAGCVPVHFGDFEKMAWNLPFTNTIRWGDIAIFGGRLPCALQNTAGVKAWLESLLAETPEMFLQIEHMRRLGRLVFAKYLTYRSSGIVGAFLGEFDESGDLLSW